MISIILSQTISNFFLSTNERTSNVRFVPFLYTFCVRSNLEISLEKKMKERKGYEEGDRENVSNWMNIHVHPFLYTSVLKAGYKRISLFRESSNNIEKEAKKKEGAKGRYGESFRN